MEALQAMLAQVCMAKALCGLHFNALWCLQLNAAGSRHQYDSLKGREGYV